MIFFTWNKNKTIVTIYKIYLTLWLYITDLFSSAKLLSTSCYIIKLTFFHAYQSFTPYFRFDHFALIDRPSLSTILDFHPQGVSSDEFITSNICIFDSNKNFKSDWFRILWNSKRHWSEKSNFFKLKIRILIVFCEVWLIYAVFLNESRAINTNFFLFSLI